MKVLISPSRPRGSVCAPPSKSMSHRLLICAGLSRGESRIENLAPSQDVLATLDCLKALGAQCMFSGSSVTIRGISPEGPFPEAVLPCRECGSTLRFFVPICLLTGKRQTLTGSAKLMSRPMTVYEELAREKGFFYESGERSLTVCGTLLPGEYRVAGNISSQFISGLLYVLPLLDGNSRIHLLPPVESRSYIDMTLSAMRSFGVRADWEDETTLRIPGKQAYHSCSLRVEGDYSNAAFFEALNYTPFSNPLEKAVQVSGLSEASLQGDRVYLDDFPALAREKAPVLDLANCPDLGPILFAVAAMQHGGSFINTRRLRMKESDRGEAMKQELAAFGVETKIEENAIRILPPKEGLHVPEKTLCGHNDHRIVMALSVLASVTGGSIEGAEAVKKSFPDFFEQLKSLSTEVTIYGMDQ